MIAPIHHEHVAIGVHGGVVGRIQFGAGGRPSVAHIATGRFSYHGADNAASVHLADAAIIVVGDEKTAGGIDCQTVRIG